MNTPEKIKELLRIEESSPKENINSTIWTLPCGLPHRIYGPAIEWNDGSKDWFFQGSIHREDGPAIENADGTVFYYIHGVHLSKADFHKVIKLSDDDKSEVLRQIKEFKTLPAAYFFNLLSKRKRT